MGEHGAITAPGSLQTVRTYTLLENLLEGSQVVRAVVVIQNGKDNFQFCVSYFGEILLKTLCNGISPK
jgi:hypothetical protein